MRHRFEGLSSEARDLVGEVRDAPAPRGAEVLVGGRAADLRDLLASLGATLPWMGLFVVGVTLVLLFLAFGSVVLPLKAVAMNVLSLSASFGALVWIFQDGHLSSAARLHRARARSRRPSRSSCWPWRSACRWTTRCSCSPGSGSSGTAPATTRSRSATGLQRTGRIITSAALLLVVVIGAFSTSGIVFIKMIGVGMVIAILVDATIVRALLVPATMRLLGRWNWWAPAPMARFWSRHGLRESRRRSSACRRPVARSPWCGCDGPPDLPRSRLAQPLVGPVGLDVRGRGGHVMR